MIVPFLCVLICGATALPSRVLEPEVIDMGVTGRRSAGPGPAGAAGEDGDDIPTATARPHAQLTLAITAEPPAHQFQHLQGGLVRAETAATQPRNEEDLQSSFARRKRSEGSAEDQDAAASTSESDSVPAASAPAPAPDDSDMFLEPDAEGAGAGAGPDPTGQPQNLFPAFQPLFPLGHSRPQLFQQEPAFSQRQSLLRPQYNSFSPLDTFRERAYPQPPGPGPAASELPSNTLLGSGNFGVIHGGTFYGEDKEDDYERTHSSLHSFYGGNGHGRPAFYRGNPEPQRYRTAEDFFANFRDFAEISAPKSAFSEFYVVYVNRNATRNDAGTVVGPDADTPRPSQARPNNIIERLAQIDSEHSSQHSEQEQEAPRKKLSKGKRKLALIKKSKKSVPVSREAYEPLLALS